MAERSPKAWSTASSARGKWKETEQTWLAGRTAVKGVESLTEVKKLRQKGFQQHPNHGSKSDENRLNNARVIDKVEAKGVTPTAEVAKPKRTKTERAR
ncbi:hypothetical protein CVT26_001306 [Gymnopilus dilepis]|uniref:Uncharacterized protein n=1 Tax=Gymnopilus dilepis TaxID=231916 RepID=A0A409Y230_9AGAR|nr:hypothetical protein CVT26_001306 [Gymnopilus dilepis]